MDYIVAHIENYAVSVSIIPTWQCPRICSHCNVGDLIQTQRDELTYSTDDLTAFCDRVTGPHSLQVQFAGGEPTMRMDVLSELVQAMRHKAKHMEISTMLMCGKADLCNTISLFDHITVSLDGLPDDHDKRRGHGSFVRTYRNIATLVDIGKAKNIAVKGIMPQGATDAYQLKYLTMLVCLGLNIKRITLTAEGPGHTRHDLETDGFARILRNKLPNTPRPCCCFRVMKNFCVTPDGSVWSGFYTVNHNGFHLGTIYDSLNSIKTAYRKALMNAPFMSDENCLSCPKVTSCWGLYCYNTLRFVNQKTPSLYCGFQADKP